MALVGRHDECLALDRLLDTARQGLSASLVMRGEAGSGKTALTQYVTSAASDFVVLGITGVESEREIAFGGLHRLLAPFFDRIEHLPAPQRAALRTALGLSDGPAADRFLVGLATISLTTMVAQTAKRLLCVIDDAQWIDRESLQALAFWGRRIDSDGVALIFSERITSETSAFDGFTVLDVTGLADAPARQLLAASAVLPIDPIVADRIVADARGNPLALVEFAKDVDPLVLLGATATQQPLPLTAVLEERYARQTRMLPADTQMLLLVAAADSSGDAALVMQAAAVTGVAASAADAAEADGLIVIRTNVEFRHPLIRSAIYSSARPVDRRAAHRALAAVTDAERDADRKAWHRAAATIGFDEDVASTLERCAVRAGKRGGHTAELALLSRAAELTQNPGRAAERRVAAADAALQANLVLQASTLTEQAMPALADPSITALAHRVAGFAAFRSGRLQTAVVALQAAARAMIRNDLALARQTLLETMEVSLFAAGNRSGEPRDVTREAAAAALALESGEDAVIDSLLLAFATYVRSGFVAAAPLIRTAVDVMIDSETPSDRVLRWVVSADHCTRFLWDHDRHDAVMARARHDGREQGELRPFQISLQAFAESAMLEGRFGVAATLLEQADDLAAAAGQHWVVGDMMRLQLAVARGAEEEARRVEARILTLAAHMDLGTVAIRVNVALVDLEVGLGRFDAALETAASVFAADAPPVGNYILPNMIEAALRTGARVDAEAAMNRFEPRATAAGTPWALGLLARSRALLADDRDAEGFYREAIALFERTRLAVELARSRLVYGEWLRRQNRRIDARAELRATYDTFATMGSDAFANRAHAELLATGEHARKRSVETANVLTPRELHVAQLAADGRTNAEIAAELYIGSTTVDYHLRKVFRKLSVTSRRQLKVALSGT